jgi:hypothetical protein
VERLKRGALTFFQTIYIYPLDLEGALKVECAREDWLARMKAERDRASLFMQDENDIAPRGE